jgi:hypothetical protein
MKIEFPKKTKNVLLVTALICASVGSYSQPTLTEACNPYPGFIASDIYIENVSEFTEGPNQNWDLTGATFQGLEFFLEFISAEGLAGSELYPDAELASAWNDSFGHSYFSIQSDKWEFLGNYVSDDFYQTTSNPLVHMQYPTTFGDTWTTQWIGETYSGGDPIINSSLDTVEVTGYGTLSAFGNSFDEVLLVERRSAQDQVGIDGPELWWTISQQLWIEGSPYPIVSRDVRHVFIDGMLDQTDIWSRATDFVVEIEENQKDDELISIFPNPFKNEINIVFESAQDIQRVLLTDQLGRHLKEINTNYRSSIKEDLSALSKGMYFLNVYRADRMQTVKLIKN